MNCHYSAQGDYKCTKPKEVKEQTNSKFTNVAFTDELPSGSLDSDQERFTNNENELGSPSSETSETIEIS